MEFNRISKGRKNPQAAQVLPRQPTHSPITFPPAPGLCRHRRTWKGLLQPADDVRAEKLPDPGWLGLARGGGAPIEQNTPPLHRLYIRSRSLVLVLAASDTVTYITHIGRGCRLCWRNIDSLELLHFAVITVNRSCIVFEITNRISIGTFFHWMCASGRTHPPPNPPQQNQHRTL